jgi:hypothetical protein
MLTDSFKVEELAQGDFRITGFPRMQGDNLQEVRCFGELEVAHWLPGAHTLLERQSIQLMQAGNVTILVSSPAQETSQVWSSHQQYII